MIGSFKCHCSKHRCFLIIYAIGDMLLCLPCMAFVTTDSLSDVNEESEKNRAQMATYFLWGITLLIGILMPPIMASMVGIQVATVALLRLLGTSLAATISCQYSGVMKIVVWIGISYSLMSVGLHLVFAVTRKKDLGSPAPSMSSHRDRVFVNSVMKMWIAAVLFTAISMVAVIHFASSGFKVQYFLVCLLGLELIMSSTYFCTMYDMVNMTKADSKYYMDKSREPEEKQSLPGNIV